MSKQNLQEEQWVKIAKFPYEVSNTGKIRSQKRKFRNKLGCVRHVECRIRKPRTNGIQPHLFVDIAATKDYDTYIRKSAYIAQEVLKAFGPKKPKGVYYAHNIDGDYTNNNINNLRWISSSELISSFQPNRLLDPKKSWKTRREKYGISGSNTKTDCK